MSAAIVLSAACAQIAGTSGYVVDPSLDDASIDGSTDSAHSDAPARDGFSADAADATSAMDAGDAADTSIVGDAADTGSATNPDSSVDYTSLDASGAWTTTNVSALTADAVDGFNGGAFDGKYFYFAPIGGAVLRLDTTLPADFAGTGAWAAQPITALGEDGGTTSASGFSGAVYDGQYVYFVPYQTQAVQQTSQVVRYDTKASFSATTSWQIFDTRAHFGTQAAGFQGAVFDTRYVYFVPNGAGASGTVVRYDTHGTFQDAASWLSVDLTTLLPGAAAGFAGGMFVSPYVYLVPSSSSSVARYDTTKTFGVAGSWTTYDTSQGGTLPYGFIGGAVAGTELLLAPNFDDGNGTFYGAVAEYSTTTAFTDNGSWSSFDTTTLPGQPQGFFGAAFDGRWVYFAPQLSNASGTISFSGVLARYDSTAAYTSAASWQSFDIQSVDNNATGFGGAVFDGTYVYFIPSTSTATFARFFARSVPATPPFVASFF